MPVIKLPNFHTAQNSTYMELLESVKDPLELKVNITLGRGYTKESKEIFDGTYGKVEIKTKNECEFVINNMDPNTPHTNSVLMRLKNNPLNLFPNHKINNSHEQRLDFKELLNLLILFSQSVYQPTDYNSVSIHSYVVGTKVNAYSDKDQRIFTNAVLIHTDVNPLTQQQYWLVIPYIDKEINVIPVDLIASTSEELKVLLEEFMKKKTDSLLQKLK